MLLSSAADNGRKDRSKAEGQSCPIGARRSRCARAVANTARQVAARVALNRIANWPGWAQHDDLHAAACLPSSQWKFVDQMLSLKTLTLHGCLNNHLLDARLHGIGVCHFHPKPTVRGNRFMCHWLNFHRCYWLSVLVALAFGPGHTLRCFGVHWDERRFYGTHGLLFPTVPSARDARVVHEPLRTPRDKLQHALRSIAWPIGQAGLSTVICAAACLPSSDCLTY
ncbi:hypothetical protein niasHS_017994 [Heterodera schachtii]|uniref:Uncharacterized protein n=1 Tax=Heterodera schachtii TaxID=97005 RepID=A0ABD2HP58_HETSC